ncbi:MAG: Haloalkane dehalogenase [Promethearchaeota archaeon]|nr:MAG: Haloalkane dehalogenase [Candidatus Lokiarchaeota archaeon]
MKINGRRSLSPVEIIPNDYYPQEEGFWFQIQKGLDKGKCLFYRDSYIISKNTDTTLLFVHGNPECSYTYRKIIHHITTNATNSCRIVAMDHIGFGLSDPATYEMVCMDHARNLLQLIQHLDLHNITLVIHDWGGPIGVGALLQDPKRVSNLILLNSTVFPLPKEGLSFENYPISWLGWSNAPYIIPDHFWGSFAAFAIFAQPTTSFTLLFNMLKTLALLELNIYPSTNQNKRIAQQVYRSQFQLNSNVRSSKRLVVQTKAWGYGNIYKEPLLGKRDTTPFYRRIQTSIKKSWGPSGQNIGVRALIGRWDPLGQNGVLKQWLNHLPQLKGNMKIFKNIGHFIEEVKYKEIADQILDVVKLTY